MILQLPRVLGARFVLIPLASYFTPPSLFFCGRRQTQLKLNKSRSWRCIYKCV
uniref:Uncharacterized protein n=1 Tax=Anguilla anguilla TaxID=7936 RepID=A0A0E9SV50_ANGAN